MGLSFGGWLAAEVAVAAATRIDKLILVDALGIKVSDRETPDILDVFNTASAGGHRRSWHDPEQVRAATTTTWRTTSSSSARATGRRSAATAVIPTCTTRS